MNHRGNRLVRNFLHLGVGQVSTTVLTIVLSAAIARTLGPAEFGLLYVVTSIATFAYVFVDWGHAAYVTREVARHPERTGELLGTVQAVRVAMTLFVCLPAAAITFLLGYDAATLALAITLILAWLPSYVVSAYSWIFRGLERMDYDVQLSVALRFASLILSLVCLYFGGRVWSLALISIASGGLALVLALWLYRRLDLPRMTVSWGTARELISGGASMMAMAVAVAVQPYINANLLYSLAPPQVAGWYAVAWNIAGTLVAPSTILASTLYPRLSRAAADTAELQHVVRRAMRPLMLLAVLGAVGTYLFADVAVGVVYGGDKFIEAARILKVFAPTLLLLYLDVALGAVVFAMGDTTRLALVKVASVVASTTAALILVPMFGTRMGNGGIGLMIGLGVGELVMVVAMLFMTIGVMTMGSLTDMLRTLVAGAFTILLMRLLPVWTPWLRIPLCIALFGAAAIAVGTIKGDDVALVLETVKQRRRGAGATAATSAGMGMAPTGVESATVPEAPLEPAE